MTVACHEDGSLITLLPDGVIDAQQGEALRVAIDRAIADGKTRFLVNLQRIRQANSAGLEHLVALARKIGDAGSRIALVGASELVADILHATRLHSRFAVFDSTEQAMASLKVGS